MLQGKKVMHLFGDTHFDYHPGESVVVPASETMLIDFPEASKSTPTQCIALAIDKEKIKEILEILNEKFAKVESKDSWQINAEQFHLQNTRELTGTINRLVHISKEDNLAKDIFANMALQELLIRLMQTQARKTICSTYQQYSTSSRFAYVVEYIHNHLNDNLTVKMLSGLACMSEPHFYRSFKRELGIAPTEYILQEKIKLAKKLLRTTNKTITDICFQSGFNSLNYFCSLFKKMEQVTPKQYQEKLKI
jgi:AraC-like DNA-binding protein